MSLWVMVRQFVRLAFALAVIVGVACFLGASLDWLIAISSIGAIAIVLRLNWIGANS